MNIDWSSDIVFWIGLPLIVGVPILYILVTASLISRSRIKDRTGPEKNSLKHSIPYLLFGSGAALLFLVGPTAWLINGDEPLTLEAIGVGMGFVLLAAFPIYMVVEYFRIRHEIVDEGLKYNKMFGQNGHLKWKDVRRVSFTFHSNWFKLQAHDGRVVRVSSLVLGVVIFAKEVLDNVPMSAIDEKTLKTLVETANGNPPDYF